MGCFKFNLDGYKQEHRSGYGGLIRGHNAKVVLMYNHVCNPEHIYMIELHGALAGLQYAYQIMGPQIVMMCPIFSCYWK